MVTDTLTVTERIKKLNAVKKSVVSRDEIVLCDEAYRYAEKMYSDRSVVIQRARGFEYLLRKKRILIQPDDILAGFPFQYAYNVNLPMQVDSDFDPATRASFHMDTEREVREVIEEIELSEEDIDKLRSFADDVDSWLLKHWHSGHTVAGYDRLLREGFGGLLERVNEAEKMCEGHSDSLEAFRIVIEACIEYVGRYECLARELGRDHLAEMLEDIKTGRPSSFEGAVQLMWLAHEMMYCENVPSAVSFGRADQYLYPFFRKDLESGLISIESAAEVIEALYVKISSQRKAYQNLTVGGCDANGRCCINELTFIFIKVTELMGFDQPSLSFRWPEKMSDDAWDAVFSLIRSGLGFPAIMNDRVCIEARRRSGIPKKDANDYSILGCVEFAAQGREHAMTELARLNLPALLLRVIGEHSETDSFDKLFNTYVSAMKEYINRTAHCLGMLEKLYSIRYPMPYLSVLTEDCIGRGLDIMNGGALYNSIGFNLGGIGTLADSLEAIRQLVYEEKQLSLAELCELLGNDFEGNEALCLRAARSCIKYGNDNEAIDDMVRKIVEAARDEIVSHRTICGGRYRLGLYTVEDHAIMGQNTGATPDGRHAGVALSNSYCASQGCDRNGPTAAINSACRFDFAGAENGMVFDLRFTPEVMDNETGKRALRSLIDTYFNKGGMEIQINVVSGETLRDAQLHPEKHEDLVVRVSGFSAYFTTLRRVTQDEIIRRTELR